MLRVGVLEVAKLLRVEIEDGSVWNYNVRASLALVLAGHHPFEELCRVFDLAPEPIRQGFGCLAAPSRQCGKVLEGYLPTIQFSVRRFQRPAQAKAEPLLIFR